MLTKCLENVLMNGDAWKEDTPQEMSALFVAEGDFGEMQVQRTAHCNSMARKDKDLQFHSMFLLMARVFKMMRQKNKLP